MTLDEALGRLEALGSERLRAQNARHGVSGEQYGAKLGDIRKLAKEARPDRALALQLWDSGNFDARLLAILLLKPKDLAPDQLDAMVRANTAPQVADWLMAYLVKPHPDSEALREHWMADGQPMAARAGWSLTAERIRTGGDGLDLAALLDRIEREAPGAPPEAQWTMNFALGYAGIHHPAHRARARAIGERLGLYRDYPTSPGCTSPFVPTWIDEMVRRQGDA